MRLGTRHAERFVLALLPVCAVAYAWARLEAPPRVGEAVTVAALGLVAGLVDGVRTRTAAALMCLVAVLSIAFRVSPVEALPFTEGTWFGAVWQRTLDGLRGFDAVALPFSPSARPDMHGLVLLACGLFALALAHAASAGSTRRLVALTVLGGGWGATTSEQLDTAALGALLLAATLWPPLLRTIRRPHVGRRTANTAVATLVVVAAGAGTAAALGAAPSKAAVDWRNWSMIDASRGKVGVQYVWDSNYDGVQFPKKPTTVLRVRSGTRALYWRASTLDLFTQDRWIESVVPLTIDRPTRAVPGDVMRVAQAYERSGWIEQHVEIAALDDARLVAASEPVFLQAPSLPAVQYAVGGLLRSRDPLPRGTTYRVWSYAPTPGREALERSRPVYPTTSEYYLRLDRATAPFFGSPGRAAQIDALFADDRYQPLWPYKDMWELAEEITREAKSPYATAVAVEGWLRWSGGFVYDEQPPLTTTAPALVDFVTRTRAGYCQHYAGAMTVMLRMLGIPSRVAVGFTSGRRRDGVWEIADRNAHAWVEAWFEGIGWVPFDPTPGRGRFSGDYTYASDSADAIRALGGDRLPGPEDPVFSPSGGEPAPATVVPETREVPWPLVTLAIAVLLALAVGLIKQGLRRARYRARDPRRRAAAALHELRDVLRDQGVKVPRAAGVEGTLALAERHLGVGARGLGEAISEGCYGPASRAEQAAGRARAELRRYRRVMREELRPRRRLKGFLSPASLLAVIRDRP
ncbi:MAG: transglutaminaseTgpA domain-containing protein [Gaiella sp.]